MINIPKLRFPEFTGEWEDKKLNSIFTKITQRNSDNQNSNVITNSATEGLVSQRDYFDKDIANKDKTDNYFIIKNGDFVYNPRKSSAAPYGPFTQYKLLNDGIVSPLYLCLRKNNSEVESKYLENYFKTTCWHQYIYENGSSGARHDRVSIHDDVLLAMPIKVPSLPEQQKIADFLSNVDSIITAETKILNTLQKKKKALMQKLFTQQLRFKSNDGTDFPAWEEKKVIDFAKVDTGANNTQDKVEDGPYPFYVRSPIIYRSNKYIFDFPEAVLTVGDGVGTGKVFHYVQGKFDCHQRVYVIHDFENVLGKYFYFYFSEKFYARVKPMSAKNSVDSVRREMITDMKIPIPCKTEQQKIAECLSSMDSLIQTQQKVVTTWQQRKKALLQQMFV